MGNVSDPKLDNLRQEILKLCADVSDLDSGGLRTHLESGGNAEILHSLLGPDVYVHAAFARETASEEVARTGFLEVLSRHLPPCWQGALAHSELEEARHVYVNDPTDENWNRFEKLKLDGQPRGEREDQLRRDREGEDARDGDIGSAASADRT